MATPLPDTPTFDEKHHFLLRKLHSLTGIVPIGVFLIEHLLTNSLAAGWASSTPGPERFNEAVRGIHHLPYLWALELFGIFLPLAFHALYGVKIALTARPNAHEYPYMANRRFTLQRVTGYIALIFIVVHLLKFRFAHVVGWGPDFLDPGNADKFAITQNGLMRWHITQLNLTVPAWITLSFYLLGLAASVFHFANGIWTFCISWGITIGAQAQRKMGYACAAIGIVLFLWGGMSLYAFAKAKPADKPPGAVAIQQNDKE